MQKYTGPKSPSIAIFRYSILFPLSATGKLLVLIDSIQSHGLLLMTPAPWAFSILSLPCTAYPTHTTYTAHTSHHLSPTHREQIPHYHARWTPRRGCRERMPPCYARKTPRRGCRERMQPFHARKVSERSFRAQK